MGTFPIGSDFFIESIFKVEGSETGLDFYRMPYILPVKWNLKIMWVTIE